MLPRVRLCLCILVVYFLAIGLVHGQDASNAKEQSADKKRASQLEEPEEGEPESVTAGTGVGNATFVGCMYMNVIEVPPLGNGAMAI